MTISLEQRTALLKAEQSRDPILISKLIRDLTAQGITLLACEMVFREAGTQTFILASPGGGFTLVYGMPTMLAQLGREGSDFTKNRAALA